MTESSHLTVAVLMGGPSSEHEVSLKSGAKVLAALDPARYQAIPVTISKTGEWMFADGATLSPGLGAERLRKEDVRVVFIAMHGEYGEDGTIQGFLEVAGFPYTGSGVAASALAMHKEHASELMRTHGVAIPDSRMVRKDTWDKNRGTIMQLLGLLGLPVVVKPANLGSSVGISIVREKGELESAIDRALAADREILVQECIIGTEVTCGILDTDGQPIALPPTEIIPKGGTFFDYKAKYTVGGSEEITPARVPDDITKRIQEIALIAHASLGCAGMSRTDMIVRDKNVYYLETNTIPGMTETSLLPQAAHAMGISFSELVSRLIDGALYQEKLKTK